METVIHNGTHEYELPRSRFKFRKGDRVKDRICFSLKDTGTVLDVDYTMLYGYTRCVIKWDGGTTSIYPNWALAKVE
jgi:hypothetical protein